MNNVLVLVHFSETLESVFQTVISAAGDNFSKEITQKTVNEIMSEGNSEENNLRMKEHGTTNACASNDNRGLVSTAGNCDSK